jgi:hypothetical protein
MTMKPLSFADVMGILFDDEVHIGVLVIAPPPQNPNLN